MKIKHGFNPIKYMYGLADCITQKGSLIFCNSTASNFKYYKNHYITFVNNHEIRSKNIVVASHYPFKKILRILFF